MEDIQSWWEVPAIAHFCYIFRAAFKLIYFDVEELEAAILNIQDPELSISLEQLITRLLQGCFNDGEVTDSNWEIKLKELIDEYCDEDERSLYATPFHSHSPHIKVKLLFLLCQIRLDFAISADVIKDMSAENMQAKCIGNDSEGYSYWYFNNERLYKESPLKISGKTGKLCLPEKSKKILFPPSKNEKRPRTRDKKIVAQNEPTCSWCIVCYNLNDWEKLLKKFSKSKSPSEKKLVEQIKMYTKKVEEIIPEKERLLRKRYLELAPKRTSSRICKVQAQKRLEEQKAAEIEEEKRRQNEIEQARKEAFQKVQVKDERRKRAEERSKIIEDRARRAQQRGMLRNFIDDYEDSDSDHELKRSSINTKASQCTENRESKNDSKSDESVDDSQSEEGKSDNDESEVSDSDNREDDEVSGKESTSDSDCADNIITDNGGSRHFTKPNDDGTYDLTKWHSTIDNKGARMHILQSSCSDIPGIKRFRTNESGSYKVLSSNGFNSTSHKENRNFQPIMVQNLKAFNVTTQRVDYVKPTARHISS